MENKAYKFRIYPNKEQKSYFVKAFGCVRFVYNHYLEKKKSLYESEGKTLSYIACANDLPRLKSEYDFLKQVDSISLQQSLRHLDTAFKNFFNNPNCGYPKYKTKRNHHHSYTTNLINHNIQLLDRVIKLPRVGLVRVKRHRNIPDTYSLKSATVSKTPSGKYFVSVLFEYENQVPNVTPEKYIGLDFSVPKMFVSSEPEIQTEERFLRHYRNSRKNSRKNSVSFPDGRKGANAMKNSG